MENQVMEARNNNLHMKSGDGESSYANNSFLQESIIRTVFPSLKQTIKGMANDDELVFSQCFKIADLGCSSSPNTLLVASNVIDIVYEVCLENNIKPPQFQVLLNDLFGNDFGTIFKMLPKFYTNLKQKKVGPCFVSAVPGSFCGRLFPDQSIHLVHSSYSLHWLSQVPKGVENNTTNVYMAKTSPPNVFAAYANQFQSDFTNFIQMRSQEIVRGGRMFLTLIGREMADPATDDSCYLWTLMAQSLLELLKEGQIQQSQFDSFNVPYYNPCEDEVKNIIQNDGSFSLDTLNIFQVNWDSYDTDYINTKDTHDLSRTHAINVAKTARATTEPLLTFHFGSSIDIDVLFNKFEKNVAEHLVIKKTRHFNFVISMTRK